jgi:predicted dinucleotide-binding enzyme
MRIAILGTGQVGQTLAKGFKLNRWEQAWRLLHR